jgi:ribosomal-protein-alanine N-acetyltransferase
VATTILPQLTIRPATRDDLDSVSRLEDLCFKDPYPAYFIAQLADANPDTFLVGVLDGSMVGYAVVERRRDYNHLVSIAVHSDYRRKGIGSRLLLALEEGLEVRKTIRLEVRRSNLAALGFYRRHGFLEAGLIEGYYSDGEDAVLMEKRVEGSTGKES